MHNYRCTAFAARWVDYTYTLHRAPYDTVPVVPPPAFRLAAYTHFLQTPWQMTVPLCADMCLRQYARLVDCQGAGWRRHRPTLCCITGTFSRLR